MNQNQETIFSHQPFRNFTFLVIALLIVSSPLLFIDKELPSFWLNQFHSPFLDRFFFYLTYLGDGLVLIPVVIALLFRSYVWAGFFTLFTIFEALLVQVILKKGIFVDWSRPSVYISDFSELHQVAGVHLHSLHTFPSGHTQTIFLVITIIVMAYKKGLGFNLVLILIATLTALSRVYLLQHFFMDIWFGALIGFGIPVTIVYLVQKMGKFPQSDKKLLKN